MGGQGRPRTSLLERFEEQYIGEPNSGCWLWTGVCNASGYGHISVFDNSGKRLTRKAHRVSYELFVGPVPEGMQVMHKCDTTCCVNPDHLKVGSRIDNQQDMANKGRGRKSLLGLPWGVHKPRRSMKFFVQFKVGGVLYRRHTGFATAEEAHIEAVAYRQAILREVGRA